MTAPYVPQQTPTYFAVHKNRYSRQQLIRDIQFQTGRKLITYVASFGHPRGSIDKADVLGFGDLLYGLKDEDIDLLIQSPGGDIDVAEKIVYMCRSRARTFRVIVPESAKSAATLIALAADSVVMSDTSELGPIDPQIIITSADGQPTFRPARSFLDGLEAIKIEAAKEGSLSPVYFPLLVHLDPALLDFCRKAIERSEQFAEKWLRKSQCKRAPKKAKRIAKALTDTERYLSHGTVIDHKEASSIGLRVEYLNSDDELWQRIWRLYCTYEIDIREEQVAKVFESEAVSLPIG